MSFDAKDAAGASKSFATGAGAGTTGDPYRSPLSVAVGQQDDATATSDSGAFGLVALFKRLLGKLPAPVSGRVPVDGSGVTQPVSLAASVAVTGTFYQATQPVSGTVAISSFPATQAVSAAALPLPTGAATDAKLDGLFGAVGPAPAANTVLARLKAIADALAGTLTVTGGGGSSAAASSVYRSLDVGVTGAVVKNSAGTLTGYHLQNRAAGERVVKFYSKATAPAASDTPLLTIPLPGGAGAVVSFPAGVTFAAGIGVRATTGLPDADAGAPATGDVVAAILYS